MNDNKPYSPTAEQDFKGIENVVFDLGGVVIDLARDKSVEHLEAIGLRQAGELLDPYVQRGPFLELETGRATAAEFFDNIRALIKADGGRDVTDTEIQDAFNAFLVDLPVERLKALRELRSRGFRVFAISNTNPVMFHSWIAEHFRAEGLAIYDYFDGVVTSFETGCCKPDREIFDTLLRRYGLEGDRTLMLDDAPANVEAARRAGLRAVRVGYTPQDDILTIINKL